jgi:hypothetical protein
MSLFNDECDYYQLLHISRFATSAEIKSAYSAEAKKLIHLETSHPKYLLVKEVLYFTPFFVSSVMQYVLNCGIVSYLF